MNDFVPFCVCAFAILACIIRPSGSVVQRSVDLFPVSIIHINDFHAR